MELLEDHAWISASFIYRSFKGDPRTVWHQRGEKLFEITRTIKIPRENGKLEISDRIENLTDTPLVPDWGYHITFRPEEGDKLILPSRQRANRDGGELPKDVESWIPAKDEGIRTETGFLHKGLLLYEASEGPFQGNTRALYKRSNPQALPKGILLSFPLAPYTQCWSCSGGAGSREFTLASDQPLFEKSWNGLGLEIGASALDHDGNTDSAVSYEGRLHPGESLTIPLGLEMLEAEETERLEKEIRSYIDKE